VLRITAAISVLIAASGISASSAVGHASGSARAVGSSPILVYANPAILDGLRLRPTQITFAADGNYTVTGLRHWHGWGSSSARADGVNHIDNCIPDCATGHISRVSVSVRLFRPGQYRGHHIYRCYAVKPAAVAYLHRVCL
jgi:hypothetical protein